MFIVISAGKLETNYLLYCSPFHCRAHISFQGLLINIFTLFPSGLPLHSIGSSVHFPLLLVPQGQEAVSTESKSTERKGSLDELEKGWRLDSKPEGRGRGRPLNLESHPQPWGSPGKVQTLEWD